MCAELYEKILNWVVNEWIQKYLDKLFKDMDQENKSQEDKKEEDS